MIKPGSPLPLLSVIVANYNNEKYVPECLGSILDQTFKDLEIVVYDDGSSDGSLAVIEGWARRHPEVFRVMHDPLNRGVAHARRQAIAAARGEYLTTLDGDDFYGDVRKLEKEMALVARHREESGRDVIAYSNILRVSEDGTPLQLMGHPGNLREGIILKEMITRDCMVPRDFIMKKSAYFEAGGYDFSLRTHEDWDLKIRLAARSFFYFAGITGVSYRQRPGGLSSLPLTAHTENMWRVFFKNIHLVAPGEREAARASFTTFMDRRQQCQEGSCLRG
jgi:glycosyltransferase involved in cell wall biosynthesis